MSEYSLKPGFVASETAERRPPAIAPPTVTARGYVAAARARRRGRGRGATGIVFTWKDPPGRDETSTQVKPGSLTSPGAERSIGAPEEGSGWAISGCRN